MCSVLFFFPTDLFICPLAISALCGPSLPALGLAAAGAAAGSMVWTSLSRGTDPGTQVPWWPVFAAPALLVAASPWWSWVPVYATFLVSPALAVLITLAVLGWARRTGRPPNLAGWLLGPCIAACASILLADLLLYAPPRLPLPDAHAAMEYSVPVHRTLVAMCIGLVGTGAVLALSSFHHQARRCGHGPRLALLGVLMMCSGGLAECTRALLITWLQGDFPAAEQAWAMRGALLTAMVLVAVVVPIAARLFAVPPGPAHNRGNAIALVMLAVLSATCALGVHRTKLALQPFADGPVSLTQEPSCPVGTCLRPHGVRSPYSYPPRTAEAWMAFTPELAVIDATLQTAEPVRKTD